MKKYFVILIFLPCLLSALTLKDKLSHAKAGDFVVTEQNKLFSILIVRNISTSAIQLEEISVPMSQINLKKTPWRAWLDRQAPGHTSWLLYQINFENEQLTESYSLTEKKWLFADDSDYLLAHILALPLTAVPERERRRLGPPPQDGENDRRPFWNPPMTKGTSKIAHPKYDVYKGKWPKDNSQLSECSILFYFDSEAPHFPFPYWLEVTNGHITLKLHTIDSGNALTTPFAHFTPPSPFNFIGPSQTMKEALRFTLLTASKDDALQFFAKDLSDPKHPLRPLTTTLERGKQGNVIYLEVTTKTLLSQLTKGHQYQWIVQSKKNPKLLAESNDRFTLQ